MSYMADTEDVASAKAEFMAAFDDAAAGGLAAKQAPAPVHMINAPVVHTAVPVSYAAVNQYAVNPYMAYPHAYGAFPYMHHYGYSYGMPYYNMPVMAVPE